MTKRLYRYSASNGRKLVSSVRITEGAKAGIVFHCLMLHPFMRYGLGISSQKKMNPGLGVGLQFIPSPRKEELLSGWLPDGLGE